VTAAAIPVPEIGTLAGWVSIALFLLGGGSFGTWLFTRRNVDKKTDADVFAAVSTGSAELKKAVSDGQVAETDRLVKLTEQVIALSDALGALRSEKDAQIEDLNDQIRTLRTQNAEKDSLVVSSRRDLEEFKQAVTELLTELRNRWPAPPFPGFTTTNEHLLDILNRGQPKGS
jgi:hypothetical protein